MLNKEKNESQLIKDLLNLKANDFIKQEITNEDVYKPFAKNGKDNVYKSIIRFIPWWQDPTNKSVIRKWVAWLENPLTNEGRYIDCPSSIGKKSILRDMYNKLKYSNSIAEQKLAHRFSRRSSCISLIQVIKDENNPSLEGKIMVFQYGTKIDSKIQSEIKPMIGKPHIPFDLFNGKPFFLCIKLIAGFNNYDDSKFLEERIPFTIDGHPIEKTQEGVKKAFEYLKKNSPDLTKYEFKEWDENTYAYVNEVIKNIVPKGQIIESIAKSSAPIQQSKESFNDKTSETTNVPSIEDIKEDSGEVDNLGNIDFDDLVGDIDDVYKDL